MSGGGGGGDTTTSQEPWDGAKPYLTNLYSRAKSVTGGDLTPFYSTGWPQRYGSAAEMWGADPTAIAGSYGMSPGQMDVGLRTGVAAENNYETAARDRLNALSYSPVSGLYGQAQGALAGTMANPTGWQGDAAGGQFNNIANGAFGQGGLGGVAAMGGDQLRRTSAGDYLSPDSNPYLADTYNAAARQATNAFNTQALPALTSQFSGSGRYGSGAQQQVEGQAADNLQRNLGDMASNLYNSNYQTERGRQLEAAGGLVNYGQAETNARLAAAGGLANLGQNNAEITQRGVALTPTAAEGEFQAWLNRANVQAGVGSNLRNLQGTLLNSVGSQYGGAINAPYQQLSNYASVIQGMPQFASTTQQGGGGGGGFNATGAAGGALGGAMMGGAATGYNPFGMAAGGLLGLGLGGFF